MMEFNCETCGVGLNAPESAIGKSVRCPNCNHAFVVKPASAQTKDDFPESPAEMAAHAAAGSTPCPSCGQAMVPDAVLCVACGYDLRKKRKLRTAISATARQNAGPAAVPSQTHVEPQRSEGEESYAGGTVRAFRLVLALVAAVLIGYAWAFVNARLTYAVKMLIPITPLVLGWLVGAAASRCNGRKPSKLLGVLVGLVVVVALWAGCVVPYKLLMVGVKYGDTPNPHDLSGMLRPTVTVGDRKYGMTTVRGEIAREMSPETHQVVMVVISGFFGLLSVWLAYGMCAHRPTSARGP